MLPLLFEHPVKEWEPFSLIIMATGQIHEEVFDHTRFVIVFVQKYDLEELFEF